MDIKFFFVVENYPWTLIFLCVTGIRPKKRVKRLFQWSHVQWNLFLINIRPTYYAKKLLGEHCIY